MRKFLPTAMLICSLSANAQITINSSDMPNSGDSVLVSYTATMDSNDVTLSGANRLWDYSALVAEMQRYEKFDSPFTFPSPFNFLFNALNTSYGNENNRLTTLPIPGISLDMAYDFLKESSTNFRQVGAGYVINGNPLPFYYSDEDVIYNFPLDYFDADTGDYKFGLPIPTIGYYGQTGHRLNFVDGWGTLITPLDTFNVLRVFSTISTVDTLYSEGFGIGTNINRPTRYEFKWLANGMQIPVLQIDATDVGGTLTVNNIEWIDTLIAGVPLLSIADHSTTDIPSVVYPNPALENSVLDYTLTADSKVSITLIDLAGRTISVVVNGSRAAGNYKQNIPVSELPNGIYFVRLQTDKGSVVHRIVVSR